MRERLTSGLVEGAPRPLEIVCGVGRIALTLVEDQYGTGFPNFDPGVRSLGMHNRHHAETTGDSGAILAEALDLEPLDVELARTAGYAHDLIQGRGRGIDERESAEWAESRLLRRGLPPVKARMARVAVESTLPTFDDDGLSGQAVDTMEFASLIEELVAKSVSSGDLSTLHTPVGPLEAHLLYGEIMGLEVYDTPDMEKFVEFTRKQAVLVNRHEYPLGQLAERLLATHKAQVIRYVEHVHAQALRGDLDSWNRIIAQDKAFYRNPDMRLG